MSPAARDVYRAGPPRWELAPPVDDASAEALAAALGLPVPLARILVARGRADADQAKAFLRPLLDDLTPPERLADLPAAVERIEAAIRNGETVLVHGDYDVDGVCAATLLTGWIRRLGGRAEGFVPHRVEHGYDLGDGGLDRAREIGAALIVTVDCGIVAHEAVARARDAGVDVVITDHHTPVDTLPPALAVVNPNRADDTAGLGLLCGAGVAWKLCQALATRAGYGLDVLVADLDLVALATVADLVPMERENRILVRYGLRAMEQTRRPGLRALMEVCGIDGRPEAGQVGFQLAPRINAVGRMGDAGDALTLLLTEDGDEARRLARHLDEVNTRRKDEDTRTLEAALEQLARDFDPERDWGVVLAGEGWHPGVIGIVASRIVERIHRPTVLIALDGDAGRGSARSIPGFDLYAAVAENGGLLVRFGGHRQAAGMDVPLENLDAFRAGFNAACRRELEGTDLRPVLKGELELAPSDATLELAEMAHWLGPHGIANPRPVFVARDVEVTSAREVGRGHLRLDVSDGVGACPGIGFGLAERISPDAILGRRVDVLFQLRVNEYRGRRSAQMNLLDVRLAEGDAAAAE